MDELLQHKFMNRIVCPPKETIKHNFIALNKPGDFGQSVGNKKISFFQWLKDVRSADMLYFYNPKDPLPAWSFWWHKLMRIYVENRSQTMRLSFLTY